MVAKKNGGGIVLEEEKKDKIVGVSAGLDLSPSKQLKLNDGGDRPSCCFWHVATPLSHQGISRKERAKFPSDGFRTCDSIV